MKIKHLFLMVLAGMFAVACSSDDDEQTFAQLIAGSYNGTLAITVNGNPNGNYENHKVTIKAQDDAKAEVTLMAFGEGAMGFTTDIVIKNVEVTAKDGTYTLTGVIDTVNGSTSVTGSLSGTIKDKKANLAFSLKPGAMPFPIVATFKSE